MQIPSVPPFQPPVRPTKPSSAGNVTRPQENAPVDSASRPTESHSFSNDPFVASAYEPIHQAMNDLPDSRADVVARGKALIADSTYPALKIISKLADIFIADAQASLVGDH